MTDAEHQTLLSNSCSNQLAKWMRETCLGKNSNQGRKYTKVDPVFLRQLAAIGNNLNQIARAINRDKWEPIDRIMVSVQLEAIERQMEKLRIGK